LNKKILFIINPVSGINKQRIIRRQINSFLDIKIFDYNIIYTKYPLHATAISKNAVKENYDIVVAVGGDGTVREVAQGLVNSNTKMAIIPTGSGNGFARHLNIPSNNISKAIKIINKQKSIKSDTATVNNNFFINVAGIGFDALVASKFANFGKRGAYPYVKIAFEESLNYKAKNYSISIDKKILNRKAFLLSIANSSQFGNNAYISPKASINDGLLDICILNEFPIHNAPSIALRIFDKTVDKSKYLEIFQGKEINIIQPSLEEAIHLDGDSFNLGKELNIKINQSSLEVIVPVIKQF
jgi:YegS/Rv2252/BmrU family lipid kinase